MLLSSSVLIAHVAALAACSSSTPTQPERPPPQEVQPSISDAAHGGTEHFYFLPPLIAAPEYEGIFDPTRSPTVEICTLGTAGCEPVIAEFTKQTGPGSETVRVDTAAEHYIVNWHTKDFTLVDGQIYRIRVLLEGQEAGHADVVAVSSGKELKNASTGDVIALKDGRTLPIKFRIEEGLDMTARVPAVTPDGVPDSVYCSSTVGWDGFFRDLVLVVFEEGSSQAERQAAIDSIDGTVVGGRRVFGDDGYYFVKFHSDDGSLATLFEVLDRLNSLPQVEHAGPEVMGDFTMHRKPVDGSLAFPPDSLPDRYYADVVHDPLCSKGQFLRHIVWVSFKDGTTQQQREAAVQEVSGVVVGGSPISEQELYAIYVDDDERGAGVCAALELLESLPYVDLASPDYLAAPAHRKPTDGPVNDGRNLPIENIVPAAAPDTLPEWVYGDPSLRISDSPVYAGTFINNILTIRFKADASQPKRQAAVDAIDGEVVGGRPLFRQSEGEYYVRIEDPFPEVPGKALLKALAVLDTLPQVRIANPVLIAEDITP